MLLSDLPTPQVLIDRTRAAEQHRARAGARDAAGVRAAAARQDPQVADRRALADRRAAPSASAARRSARPRCSPTPASPTSACPIRSIPSNAPRLLALMDRAADLDHRRSPGRRARLVGRDAARRPHARRARQGRRRLPSLRHRSGRRIRSGFIQPVGVAARAAAARAAEPRRPRRITRASEDELRAIAAAGSRDARRPARRAPARRASRSTKSRSAPRRRCASAPDRQGVTELRPGNYVYFDRTQVALGAASLDDCALTVLATVVSKHAGTASSSTAAARR